MATQTGVPFVIFARDILGVNLTNGQRVLVTVAFDGVDPIALPANDRELARQLFGDVDTVPLAPVAFFAQSSVRDQASRTF